MQKYHSCSKRIAPFARRIAPFALAALLAAPCGTAFSQPQNRAGIPLRETRITKSEPLPESIFYGSAKTSYGVLRSMRGDVGYTSFGASAAVRSFFSQNVSLLAGVNLLYTKNDSKTAPEDKRGRNEGSVGVEMQIDPDTSRKTRSASFAIGTFFTMNTNCDDFHGDRSQGSAAYFTLKTRKLEMMFLFATDNNREKDAFDLSAAFQYNWHLSRNFTLSFRGGYEQINTAVSSEGIYLPHTSAKGGITAEWGIVRVSFDASEEAKCLDAALSVTPDDNTVISLHGKKYTVSRQPYGSAAEPDEIVRYYNAMLRVSFGI